MPFYVDICLSMIILTFLHYVSKTLRYVLQFLSILTLAMCEGEEWKNIRSTFTPIFTSGKMKAMMVFVQETCKRLINELDDLSEKKEAFELRDLLGKYSMDTIGKLNF